MVGVPARGRHKSGNATDLTLSSHPGTHPNRVTSGRGELLIKEVITAKDYKTTMKNNYNTSIGMGIITNAGKVAVTVLGNAGNGER